MTAPFDLAEEYRARGWSGPLALPPRRKSPPPDGFTGYNGRWPEPADWDAWRKERLTNIGLRLPPGVVGLDVDAYDAKPGAATLAACEAEWGSLPRTWISTSREGPSGIRFFRVPQGAPNGSQDCWPTEAGPGIEIIRHAHRYAVVAPSVHPEGRIYRWRDPDGRYVDELPRLGDLAELPTEWVAGLTGFTRAEHTKPGSRASRRADDKESQRWIDSLPKGEPCRYVGKLAAEALESAQRGGGASAHDRVCADTLALLRAGEKGHPGVARVLQEVRVVFIDTVADRASATTAGAEFDRLVYGGVLKVRATPGERTGCDCGADASGSTFGRTHRPEPRNWPEPPDDAAFYGLLGKVVRAYESHSEADPVALLANLIAAFGAAVGSRPHFRVGATYQPARTNFVLVGRSGKSRKGDSQAPAQAIFNGTGAGQIRIASGLSTGEGLIATVRDRVTREVTDKKTGEMMLEVVDEGVTDKRILIVEAEFARVLNVAKRQGNTLTAVIRDAWDCRDLEVLTKSSTRATRPHIAIVGHITAEELRRELDDTTAANGFGNRFVWVAVKRSKELPRPEPLAQEAFLGLQRRVLDAVRVASTIGEMDFTPAADADWREVYHELSGEREGLAGHLLGRAEAQVLRIAMIFALTDGDALINEDHLLAALALWEYVEAGVLYLFGEALGNPVADAILSALLTRGRMTRSDINRLFGGHRTPTEISTALAQLERSGLATMATEVTDGRPREWWSAS